jgi:hypothetical protein
VTPPAPKRTALAHEARLDILCCLDPDDPLGVEAIIKRVKRDERIVRFHLKVLNRFQLVGRERQRGEVGPTEYVLRIAEHPEWVAAPVEAHRGR